MRRVCHEAWQKVDGVRQICHLWQEVAACRLTAITTFLLIALIVSLAVAAATAMARWLGDDGGPRHSPLPRAEDSWSIDQPSRPYATL
jgi:hypothetical protein